MNSSSLSGEARAMCGDLVGEFQPDTDLIDIPHRRRLRNHRGELSKVQREYSAEQSGAMSCSARWTSGMGIFRSNTSGKGKFADPDRCRSRDQQHSPADKNTQLTFRGALDVDLPGPFLCHRFGFRLPTTATSEAHFSNKQRQNAVGVLGAANVGPRWPRQHMMASDDWYYSP